MTQAVAWQYRVIGYKRWIHVSYDRYRQLCAEIAAGNPCALETRELIPMPSELELAYASGLADGKRGIFERDYREDFGPIAAAYERGLREGKRLLSIPKVPQVATATETVEPIGVPYPLEPSLANKRTNSRHHEN